MIASSKTSIRPMAYTKHDLKKLLMNPELDLDDAKEVAAAKTMHREKWGRLLDKKVKPFVTPDEYDEIKNSHVLPGNIVKLIIK